MIPLQESLATPVLSEMHRRLSAGAPHIACLAVHLGAHDLEAQKNLVRAQLQTPVEAWQEVTSARAFVSFSDRQAQRAVIFLSQSLHPPRLAMLEISKGALASPWALSPLCDRLDELELAHEWGHVMTAGAASSQMMWEYQANRFVMRDAAQNGDKALAELCVKTLALQAFLGAPSPHYGHAFHLLRKDEASDARLFQEAEAWLELRCRALKLALTRGDVPSYLEGGSADFSALQAPFKALAHLKRPATAAEMQPFAFLEQAGHGTLPALAALVSEPRAFSNPLCASLGRLVLRSVETLAPSYAPSYASSYAPQVRPTPVPLPPASWPQFSALS